MSKPRIILDMDCTITNLIKNVIDIHNKEFNEEFNWRDIKTWEWKETGKPISYFYDVMKREHTFLDAEPMERIVIEADSGEVFTYYKSLYYIEKLYNEGYDIHIATCPIWDSKYCMNEKVNWVKKWLPFLSSNIIFTEDKHLLANKNTILLDDHDKYLIPFDADGGMAVAYKQGWTTYNKYTVDNMKGFYDLVHKVGELK